MASAKATGRPGRARATRTGAVVPLPTGLTMHQAMQLGTAGFTAMQCVLALESAGPRAGQRCGPGHRRGRRRRRGGRLALLAARGSRSSPRPAIPPRANTRTGLGATEIIDRAELAEPGRALGEECWAGAVDTVAGRRSRTSARRCTTAARSQPAGTPAAWRSPPRRPVHPASGDAGGHRQRAGGVWPSGRRSGPSWPPRSTPPSSTRSRRTSG